MFMIAEEKLKKQWKVLKEHKHGIIIASLGWIINIPYWFYELTIRNMPVIAHSRELFLEHIFIFGTIPIFMLFGYLYDKKVTLEKQLIDYSNFLGEKIEERTEDLEKKVRELQGLYEISDLLRKELRLEGLGEVTKKVAELIGVEECCIILYDKENMTFRPLSPAYGMDDERLKIFNLTLEDAAETLDKWREKDPLVSNTPREDGRLMKALTETLSEHNLLLAKLLVAGEFLGILRLANKRDGDFTEDDAHLAEIIASRIGAALHTMMLFAEIQESEEYYRGLMENAADAIFVLDRNGKCLDANSKAVDLTGYSKEKLIEMRIEELFPASVQQLLTEKLSNTVEKGRCSCDEMSIITKDGKEVPVEISSSTMVIGEKKMMMTIIRDVTERKKMEKEIFESNKRLQLAYEELKKLAKVKDELIARVSHELRTPLTVTKGILEVLKNEETQEDRLRLYQTALDALQRQNAIIGDLIDISRAQRGELKLSLQQVKLKEAVETVISEFVPLAEGRGITIRREYEDGLPKVIGDPKQIAHALRNLISNAVKFNKDGGEVGISVRTKKDAGMVELCVRDTGIGIPQEHLDKIFDRFYQVDGSLTRRYGGTGLGLAIVKEIIEAHNGRVTVESKPEEGSMFCVTLPIANQT